MSILTHPPFVAMAVDLVAALLFSLGVGLGRIQGGDTARLAPALLLGVVIAFAIHLGGLAVAAIEAGGLAILKLHLPTDAAAAVLFPVGGGALASARLCVVALGALTTTVALTIGTSSIAFLRRLRQRLTAATSRVSRTGIAAIRTLVPSSICGGPDDAADTSAADTSSPPNGARGSPQQTTRPNVDLDAYRTEPTGAGPDTIGPLAGPGHGPSTSTAAGTDEPSAADAVPSVPAFRLPVERLPPCPQCRGVLAQELITEHRPRAEPLVYDGFWCSRCDTGFQQCPTCDQLHRPTAACPVAALRDA